MARVTQVGFGVYMTGDHEHVAVRNEVKIFSDGKIEWTDPRGKIANVPFKVPARAEEMMNLFNMPLGEVAWLLV